MTVLLLSLALVVITGIGLLIKRGLESPAGGATTRVCIVVKDQEPWLEGFMYTFFHSLNRLRRWEVVVLDDRSRDGTVEVLKRLRKGYPFEILTAGAPCESGSHGNGDAKGDAARDFCLDVRGLKGRALVRTPLNFPPGSF